MTPLSLKQTMCRPAVSSCVFGLSSLQLRLSEPEQKEQSAVSPVKTMQQPSSQQLKAKALCLKRPRKQLSVLLPVEFVEEGCVFQAKKSLKRALVWDREDSSSSREDIVLQPLKRMAL